MRPGGPGPGGARFPGMQEDPMQMLSNLKGLGAQYDAAKLIPFSEVRKQGLAHCILSLLRNSQPTRAIPPVQDVRKGNRSSTK
jgi:hypothetical protein